MIPLRLRLRVLLPLVMVSSCVINSDKYPRPRDLSPSWLVDRPRILAVVAEPPEVRPGEASSLSALLVDPDGTQYDSIWLGCLADESSFGCATAFADLDLENSAFEDLIEAGVIGFEPGFPPVYMAPVDALDALGPNERLEGRYALAQMTAFPTEDGAAPVDDVDFNQIESGYKRVVISEANTPNHNPTISDFLVDRLQVFGPDTVVEVEAGQRYELAVLLDDGAREVYEFVDRDGVVEVRTEEPYASWFSTGGEVIEPITLHPFMESTWQAPDEVGEGVWYVVVRDRRGGMVWHAQPWRVRG